MGNFSLADLEYRFWTGLKNGTIGTVGAKGDPGGFTSGTVLGISNLNDIKTAGIYRQASGADATSDRNYPSLREGILLVHEISGTGFLVQEYIPFTQETRVTYRREFFNPTWSPWRAFNSTRVDQTAGRAIYQWDDLNNREQLVYGDTGWRDIAATVVNGWTATGLLIRRNGNVVSLIAGSLNGTAATSDVFLNLPAGFAVPTLATQFGIGNGTAIVVATLSGASNNINTASRSASVYFNHSWITNDAWPTTLPGLASGTIPNT